VFDSVQHFQFYVVSVIVKGVGLCRVCGYNRVRGY
jgi:hypothetical protein